MRLRRVSFVLVALLAVGACGSSAAESNPGVQGAGEPGAAAVLPDVDVVDVGAGETVNLRSLLPSDRPLLLWFWAPH